MPTIAKPRPRQQEIACSDTRLPRRISWRPRWTSNPLALTTMAVIILVAVSVFAGQLATAHLGAITPRAVGVSTTHMTAFVTKPECSGSITPCP
jgi:hypothetical protein